MMRRGQDLGEAFGDDWCPETGVWRKRCGWRWGCVIALVVDFEGDFGSEGGFGAGKQEGERVGPRADDVDIPGDVVFGAGPVGDPVVGPTFVARERDAAVELGVGRGEGHDGHLFVADGNRNGAAGFAHHLVVPPVVGGAELGGDVGVRLGDVGGLAGVGVHVEEGVAIAFDDEPVLLRADGAAAFPVGEEHAVRPIDGFAGQQRREAETIERPRGRGSSLWDSRDTRDSRDETSYVIRRIRVNSRSTMRLEAGST